MEIVNVVRRDGFIYQGRMMVYRIVKKLPQLQLIPNRTVLTTGLSINLNTQIFFKEVRIEKAAFLPLYDFCCLFLFFAGYSSNWAYLQSFRHRSELDFLAIDLST